MLSLFPEILFLSPFAAVMIRITIAGFFAYSAWSRFSRPDSMSKILSVAEIAVAVGIFAGSWTQAAALAGVAVLLVTLAIPHQRRWALSTVVLALVMTATLVITGPGPFAFDLPL